VCVSVSVRVCKCVYLCACPYAYVSVFVCECIMYHCWELDDVVQIQHTINSAVDHIQELAPSTTIEAEVRPWPLRECMCVCACVCVCVCVCV
jgi:hypothetical protein